MKKNLIPNILFALKTSFVISPFLFILKCFFLLFTTFIPIAIIWIWKEVINSLTLDIIDTSYTMNMVFIYLLLLIFKQLNSSINEIINFNYNDKVEAYREQLFMSKIAKVSMSYFDSATLNDQLSIARNGFDSLTSIIWDIFDTISCFVSFIISFLIIIMFNFYIALIVFITIIPYYFFEKYLNSETIKISKLIANDERKKNWFYNILKNDKARFEIKLNNLGDYFFAQYYKLYILNAKKWMKLDLKGAILETLKNLLISFCDVIVIVSSITRIIEGSLQLGDLQYNLNIVSYFRSNNENFFLNLNKIFKNNTLIQELKEFIGTKTAEEESGIIPLLEISKIEFIDVCFKYPNSNNLILDKCTFVINENEKIGLVGLNGSGKSTIIKLLLRFYDVNEGEILINGINIKNYELVSLRKAYKIFFQENANYNLKIREIIALSDYKEMNNNLKLDEACKLSGFDKITNNDYNSYLGRYFSEEGIDLSGGQKQLLALSRAYFSSGNFYILDEPSASLDVITEDRIFKQLYDFSNKKGGISITHRLSNTIVATKILVLEGGKIIEVGNHQELMNKNGVYKKLFDIQADKYL